MKTPQTKTRVTNYTQLEKDTISAADGLSNSPGRAVIVVSYEAGGGSNIEYCIHSKTANTVPDSVSLAIRDLYTLILERIKKI